MAKRATCQLGYLWDIYGICVEYLWDMYGWGNVTLIRDHSNSLVLPTADHHGCLRAFHFCSHLSCELSVSLKLFNQLKPLNTRKEKHGIIGWKMVKTTANIYVRRPKPIPWCHGIPKKACAQGGAAQKTTKTTRFTRDTTGQDSYNSPESMANLRSPSQF